MIAHFDEWLNFFQPTCGSSMEAEGGELTTSPFVGIAR